MVAEALEDGDHVRTLGDVRARVFMSLQVGGNQHLAVRVMLPHRRAQIGNRSLGLVKSFYHSEIPRSRSRAGNLPTRRAIQRNPAFILTHNSKTVLKNNPKDTKKAQLCKDKIK